VILLRDGHKGTLVVPGGRKEVTDDDGADTCSREFCEEVWGLEGDRALDAGRLMVDDALRRGSFSGPYGRADRHQAFLMVLEHTGEVDKIYDSFVPNDEITEAYLVPASALSGSKTSIIFDGVTHELHVKIGHDRVTAIRGMIASGPLHATLSMSPAVGGTDAETSGDELDEHGADGDREPMSQYEAQRSHPEASPTMIPAVTPGASPMRAEAQARFARANEPAPAAGITAPQECQYAAMRCRGCDQEMGIGAWMIPGGCGMVHNQMVCYQEAAARRIRAEADEYEGEKARQRRIRDEVTPGTLATIEEGPAGDLDLDELSPSRRMPTGDERFEAKPPRPDINLRGTQLIESLSVSRRDMIRLCLEGGCAHAGTSHTVEPRMTCIGHCHRQLHGVKCAQITHGHAVIGCFECPDCQLAEIFGHDGPFPEPARRDAEETMILTLSRGSEKTGSGYADFVNLQSEWALEYGGGQLKLPVDNEKSLKLFLTWIVRQKDRPRSLPSLWRVAGSYMIKTGRPNLTRSGSDASAHYSSLLDEHGVEEHPRTSATPRMLSLVFSSLLEKHCPQVTVRSRTGVALCCEAGLGMRVGEALTGGDYHGLMANHLVILRQMDSNLVTIEAMLEHSKTKFKRYANCLGTTLGKAALPFEITLRQYWKDAGFKIVSWVEGGFEFTGVDYQVVRVSFLGMPPAKFEALLAMLKVSRLPEVRIDAVALADRARKRYEAKHSKDKRYINIFGSHSGDSRLHDAARELIEAGFGEMEGRESFVTIAPGPLIRATIGSRLSHMPLDPSSTYATLHKLFDEAYHLANPTDDPDPWLDLQGLDHPLWGHHSLRRLADTVARATMAKTGISESDIDLMFGWQEKMYSRKMQHHYETRFNRDRRYRVTMYL